MLLLRMSPYCGIRPLFIEIGPDSGCFRFEPCWLMKYLSRRQATCYLRVGSFMTMKTAGSGTSAWFAGDGQTPRRESSSNNGWIVASPLVSVDTVSIGYSLLPTMSD